MKFSIEMDTQNAEDRKHLLWIGQALAWHDATPDADLDETAPQYVTEPERKPTESNAPSVEQKVEPTYVEELDKLGDEIKEGAPAPEEPPKEEKPKRTRKGGRGKKADEPKPEPTDRPQQEPEAEVPAEPEPTPEKLEVKDEFDDTPPPPETISVEQLRAQALTLLKNAKAAGLAKALDDVRNKYYSGGAISTATIKEDQLPSMISDLDKALNERSK